MKKYIPRPGVPKPTTPTSGNSDTVKRAAPIRKHSPNPEPTPKPDKKKRKPAPGLGVKRRDVSDEQLVPRRVKPTPNRRRFLDQLNEMNKRSR